MVVFKHSFFYVVRSNLTKKGKEEAHTRQIIWEKIQKKSKVSSLGQPRHGLLDEDEVGLALQQLLGNILDVFFLLNYINFSLIFFNIYLLHDITRIHRNYIKLLSQIYQDFTINIVSWSFPIKK